MRKADGLPCLPRSGMEGEDVMTNEHFFVRGRGKEVEKVNELS